jgi:hypothetical protein
MKAGSLNRFEWTKAINRSGLLLRAKVVACALAVEFCNEETGRLNPGLAALADATGQTLDTVKRAIRDLIEGGWLARTEGRGRGNKTSYTLLSPGNVISISAVKKGTPVHQLKGGTGAPLTRQKGAPVHGKGGTRPTSYIKDKQSLEQKGGHPWAAYEKHRFKGNVFDGPCLLPKASSWHDLNAWSDWLKERGFPKLCEMPISQRGAKDELFAVPYRKPPTDAERCSEAQAYFAALMSSGSAAYAAG